MVEAAEKSILHFHILPCGLPIFLDPALLEKGSHHIIRTSHRCPAAQQYHDLYVFHYKESPKIGITCRAYLEHICPLIPISHTL